MGSHIMTDFKKVDEISYPYIFEQDMSVLLKAGELTRTNIYFPKSNKRDQRYPVLLTYCPYGKDVPYERYVHPLSLFLSV